MLRDLYGGVKFKNENTLTPALPQAGEGGKTSVYLFLSLFMGEGGKDKGLSFETPSPTCGRGLG